MKLNVWIFICGIFFAQAIYAETLAEPSQLKGGGGVKQSVTVNLTQSKVARGEKGGEKLVEASSVKPGDTLEYKATYTNVSSKPVTGVLAVMPIPEGLEYQANSSRPSINALVATKDARFAREPLSRRLPDGRVELVPYNEYRQVRWEIGSIPPGGVVEVYARAKVEGGVKAITSSPSTVVTPLAK
jgi:uncharacterized repeat protein (TIGR01451 family)